MSVFWLNKGGMLGAMPLPESTRWRLFAVVTPNAEGEVPPASLEFFQRALTERAGDTTTRLGNPIWLANFSVHRRMVDHYRLGRAFLAGDAAHIQSPSGGQGMNTGIQDAFNLAWKLALVVHGKADAKLLDTYEEERRPVAAKVLSETDTNFKAVWSQNPVFRFLRDHVLFPVLELPGVTDFIFYRGSELDINYRGSSLAQDHPRILSCEPRSGDRAPDAPLHDAAANGPTSVLRQLRTTRFTLLLFEGTNHTAAGYQPLRDIARHVEASLGDEVQTRLIMTDGAQPGGPDGGRGGSGVLLDPGQQAHRIYHAGDASLYLIRPDGYVGFHSHLTEEEPVRRYLGTIFTA
jgi:hypothetical protein